MKRKESGEKRKRKLLHQSNNVNVICTPTPYSKHLHQHQHRNLYKEKIKISKGKGKRGRGGLESAISTEIRDLIDSNETKQERKAKNMGRKESKSRSMRICEQQ
jgi:hypothetical protein